MRKLALLLSLLAVVFVPRVVLAAPQSFSFTSRVTYPVSLKDGTGLPPSVGHGLSVVVLGKRGWGMAGEVAGGTGLAAFQPSVQLMAGPVRKFSDRFVLGLTLFYSLTPPYGTSPALHTVGTTLAPAVPLGNGVTLIFPMGPAYNATTGIWSQSFTVKLALKLPTFSSQ